MGLETNGSLVSAQGIRIQKRWGAPLFDLTCNEMMGDLGIRKRNEVFLPFALLMQNIDHLI